MEKISCNASAEAEDVLQPSMSVRYSRLMDIWQMYEQRSQRDGHWVEFNESAGGMKERTVFSPDIHPGQVFFRDVDMPGVRGVEMIRKVEKEGGADSYSVIFVLDDSQKGIHGVFSVEDRSLPLCIGEPKHDFIRQVEQCVKDNLDNEHFGIDMLVGKLKMNRNRLTRNIRSITGKTVKDYLRDIRLQIASHLLLDNDLTVSEVAFRLGYSMASNFTRSFTRQFGMSPREFINLNKKL